jgi:dTMP kinase
MKGIFITFEGPEGAGKSTHIRLLAAYLRQKGLRVLLTREPGGTKISEAIRKILLSRKNKKMSDTCELMLYLAARAQLVEEVILPALKKGKVVISDRFMDATTCYQGYGAGINLGLIKRLNLFVTKGIKPDLTLILDLNAKEGLRRAGRKDRIEEKALAFHRRVHCGYLKLARQQPKRIKLIPVCRTIKETQGLVRKQVMRLLS